MHKCSPDVALIPVWCMHGVCARALCTPQMKVEANALIALSVYIHLWLMP